MSSIDSVMAAAAEVQAFCEGHRWKFCFIGGVAVQRWGMPRFTQDVDLTLLTGFGTEEPFIDAVLAKFPARLHTARQFAMERRVLLARTVSGIDLDFALGAFPFEEESTRRASTWKVSDQISLTTCSAEDLVIHKVFASRDRDWADVESVLSRQNGLLDYKRIRAELPPLLEMKEDFESLPKLEKLISTVNRRAKS